MPKWIIIWPADEPSNWRNGYGKKTVVTDTGQIELEVPRDRQARF